MRKLLLTLFILSVSIVVHSQNENPFAEFGYNVLVATSSKGEFTEFHDQTDIVEIGSVLFNRHTKEIVKVLDRDETTIDISSATAAMSIDPLCEKYYWISPYVYCKNNPIIRIDPDGRDDYQLNRDGTMSLLKKTDDQFHNLYATNTKGKLDKGNSLQVSRDVISSKVDRTESIGGDATATFSTYTIFGDDKATGIFEFAANNTDVEWSLTSVSLDGAKGYEEVNFLSTSNISGAEYGGSFIFQDLKGRSDMTYRNHSHNHPEGWYPISWGDVGFAGMVQDRFPSATFSIYLSGKVRNGQKYTKFDRNSDAGVLDEIIITSPAPKKK